MAGGQLVGLEEMKKGGAAIQAPPAKMYRQTTPRFTLSRIAESKNGIQTRKTRASCNLGLHVSEIRKWSVTERRDRTDRPQLHHGKDES